MNTTSSQAGASPRLQGASSRAIAQAQSGMAALQRQDAGTAERALRAALLEAPQHPEILRLLAIALRLQQRTDEALQALTLAAQQWPGDALIQNGLGTARDAAGDREGALAAFRRACELAPHSAELWANLGKTLSDHGAFEEALPVLQHALSLFDHRTTRLRLAYALRVLGHTDASAASYRELLSRNAADSAAWLGLAGLKTRQFSAQDLDVMREALTRVELNDDDRISIGFALAKAEEDHAQYPQAFRTLAAANALTRRIRPWHAAEFTAHVDRVLAAFAQPPVGAPNGQGDEVIFIVSMPRAGSSLTEQILASHPQIEGGGELDDLTAVIMGESARRSMPFPDWVGVATPQDWQRLGREYLDRTRRWQTPGRRFTDKLPGNWLRAGAALAMLPGARIVDCRRDALESCLSCYRQLFLEGAQAFSYDLADIAAYWRDYDRACRRWQTLYPSRVYVQNYEALLAQPQQQIAQLLEFCAVPFDAACLDHTATNRTVRTASASQVREPLMRDTARAHKYGPLLDPLRAALGLAPFRT
jgi:Flp pilus assembly protein TadD